MATLTKKPTRVSKVKKVANETKEATPTTKKVVRKTKVDTAKLDTKNIKDTVKQVVESEREIKYNYPAEIDNQLDRKAWRQKTRNKLNAMQLKITKAEDGSKEKAKLEKEYREYRKQVLLVP